MTASEPFFREFAVKFNGRKQFNEYLERCERDDFYGFLIWRKADDVLLGNVNLFHVIRRNLQSANVGYFVGAPQVRKGYATEALQLLLRFALRKLKLHRVEANIQTGNFAVNRLGEAGGVFKRRPFAALY